MGYRLWGARLDVAIDAADVEVMAEYDLRGQLGGAEIPACWQRLLITVTIVSSAPADEIARVVATAHQHSPVLASLSPAIERIVHLDVRTAGNEPFPRR
jgi:hypothetical protein